MKGVSTIVAVVLVVLIVVAMVSLTYTFAMNLISTTGTAATEQTAAVAERMQKDISIIVISCNELVGGTRSFTFTIKNIGSKNISPNELAVFLDGRRVDEDPPFTELGAGTVDLEKTVTNQTPSQGAIGTHTIMISAPAREVSQDVVCP